MVLKCAASWTAVIKMPIRPIDVGPTSAVMLPVLSFIAREPPLAKRPRAGGSLPFMSDTLRTRRENMILISLKS